MKYFSIKAFTLLELLIVVGIITFLSIAGLFTLRNVVERARIAQALSDIQEIRQAVEAYHADIGVYPPDVCPGQDPGLATDSGTGCLGPFAPVGARWRGPYLRVFPQRTPWRGNYDYEFWTAANVATQVSVGHVCAGMSAGIYVSMRPQGGWGIQNTSPPRDIEQYFKGQGQDLDWCADPNGVVYFLIKRI